MLKDSNQDFFRAQFRRLLDSLEACFLDRVETIVRAAHELCGSLATTLVPHTQLPLLLDHFLAQITQDGTKLLQGSQSSDAEPGASPHTVLGGLVSLDYYYLSLSSAELQASASKKNPPGAEPEESGMERKCAAHCIEQLQPVFETNLTRQQLKTLVSLLTRISRLYPDAFESNFKVCKPCGG